MGVPISELALSNIMDRFDVDHDGQIDFEEFERVMHELEPKEEERWSWGSIGNKLKQATTLTRTMTGSNVERKVQCAYPLSDIDKVESLNVCSSEATSVFVNSSWAELIFAIYVKDRYEPFIMVCSKPEHRKAWVYAFKTCCVKSVLLRAGMGSKAARKIRSQIGWQHRIIRATLFSLVVCNDLEGLQQKLARKSTDVDINDQDEYNGYTVRVVCFLCIL